jgi:hypothetical protein
MVAHTARHTSTVASPRSKACVTVTPRVGSTTSSAQEGAYSGARTAVNRSQKSLRRTELDGPGDVLSARNIGTHRSKNIAEWHFERIANGGEQFRGGLFLTAFHLGQVAQRDGSRSRDVAQCAPLVLPAATQLIADDMP